MFRRAGSETIAVIQFQKSDKTGAHQVAFTIDLGVYSLVIADAYGGSRDGSGSIDDFARREARHFGGERRYIDARVALLGIEWQARI